MPAAAGISTPMSRTLTLAVVLAALPLGGCVEMIALAASSALGATGVYQRWEDRGVQRGQTEEIKALREEITRTRKVLENRPAP